MDAEQHDAGDLHQADSSDTDHADPVASELSLSGSWADLIDRIKHTASALNEERARLQHREELLQALARRTHDDVQEANERADRAETHAREIEAQSQREIAHWQQRALAAEAELRTAKDWMAKVRATVMEGFE